VNGIKAHCFLGNCATGRGWLNARTQGANLRRDGKLEPSRLICMRSKPNIRSWPMCVFLDKVGETLRQATADITREELPDDHPAAPACDVERLRAQRGA
jgi:hypothetical protein